VLELNLHLLSANSKPSIGERSKGIQLEAPLRISLERALDYIDIDEYVRSDSEVAPVA